MGGSPSIAQRMAAPFSHSFYPPKGIRLKEWFLYYLLVVSEGARHSGGRVSLANDSSLTFRTRQAGLRLAIL